jgi:glutamate--cysteine ligase
MVDGWTHDEVAASRDNVWREGLRASFRGGKIVQIAERLLTIAEGGLARRAIVDKASGKDERMHLERLRKLVERGQCPADAVLEGLDREKDPARAFMDRVSFE